MEGSKNRMGRGNMVAMIDPTLGMKSINTYTPHTHTHTLRVIIIAIMAFRAIRTIVRNE